VYLRLTGDPTKNLTAFTAEKSIVKPCHLSRQMTYAKTDYQTCYSYDPSNNTDSAFEDYDYGDGPMYEGEFGPVNADTYAFDKLGHGKWIPYWSPVREDVTLECDNSQDPGFCSGDLTQEDFEFILNGIAEIDTNAEFSISVFREDKREWCYLNADTLMNCPCFFRSMNRFTYERLVRDEEDEYSHAHLQCKWCEIFHTTKSRNRIGEVITHGGYFIPEETPTLEVFLDVLDKLPNVQPVPLDLLYLMTSNGDEDLSNWRHALKTFERLGPVEYFEKLPPDKRIAFRFDGYDADNEPLPVISRCILRQTQFQRLSCKHSAHKTRLAKFWYMVEDYLDDMRD
jgi:hypothetical protein